MTDSEIAIIKSLRHPVFTVEYVKGWIARRDHVVLDPEAAMRVAEAKGFYQAVQAIAALKEEWKC